MSKIPRPSLKGTMSAASHNHASAQAHEQAVAQLHDADVPSVSADLKSETPLPRPAARSSRTKAKAVEPELKDYAHRSLYARPETFDLIRELAFTKRTSAQALYREGLFLMLKAHGKLDGKKLDDM